MAKAVRLDKFLADAGKGTRAGSGQWSSGEETRTEG